MSTQILSFLIFGIAFIAMFLFYKKADRIKVMIVCGIITLLPFSFGFFQIRSKDGLYVIPLIFFLFIVFRYYKGHYRYFFLFFSAYFSAIMFSVKTVKIIDSHSEPTIKLVLTSNLSFTYKSGKKVVIPIKGRELINNLESNLYVESVEYGDRLFESENSKKLIKIIPPFSYENSEITIDYYFSEPPLIIDVHRNQGDPISKRTIRNWIHD